MTGELLELHYSRDQTEQTGPIQTEKTDDALSKFITQEEIKIFATALSYANLLAY